ncbi:CRS2-associated factor 1, chloroplastic-like [Lotus japonicus]|uniref:CRS2-associated factor 1, chloroplastic-like n=1 Tax=Lotus japonicus TaxID=34305 RepID=UPI00258D4A7A|nr:CRS2-associated factor 1, chloroplastic-like [Lotus japonicus]XP_057447191.1 CRS2-associated factor 1, chloroplastic-like [Lotus japonicus]XP_057447192.1 CRS2-associated factor 1, chloroplastic-like [Lotus japonicus]XP_057447194.1 CRS2-associated factor 1, chloroplastic-like [Lotus japonicus]XP_057447195.1 CRS2-associated factor 1, chloroplastic-like [Lotus japonicus]XP_057447196.1 CRS2-associated factor 1, chloroplastic-like [Lotus japonicus]XP_057447197.1 CRS2-associated factor 1, chloro
MGATVKVPFPFPITDPNPTRQRPSTEVHFSRWNNALAVKLQERRRPIQEIEDEIRRTRRFDSAENIANTATESSTTTSTSASFKSVGTPSTPSRPSIPGKKSKYSKSPPKPKPPRVSSFRFNRFLPGPSDVRIGEDGVSYVVDGAPFEFRYSYTETPAEKPVEIREPVAPFGPDTVPRPWTGRNPLPPGKLKKFKVFGKLVLPPADKKGTEPVQSPGRCLEELGSRYVEYREEVMGEPLTQDEINDLVMRTRKSPSHLSIGRDGLTHNMLENVHTHWMRQRVCQIKCRGVCTVDMDNVCHQLEERTGGKIIYRKGGTVYLFRGRNYDYRTRPRFPLMLWKPVSPVYPRLVKQVPEGLTLEKATEMRQKGSNLIPICKLGKNGVYCDLVKNVREAFEVCDLVRINCEGLTASDYRRIGAKLKDLVPCVLLSFENKHILIWRGLNWRSTFLSNDGEEVNKINVDSEHSNTLPSDEQELSVLNSVEHLINESHDISIPSSSDDASICKVMVPCPSPSENSNLPVSVVTDATLIPVLTHEVDTTEDVLTSSGTLQSCGSTSSSVSVTSGNSIDGMGDPHIDKLQDGFRAAEVSQPSSSATLLLLEQAVKKGVALVLDEESLDADHIYQTTMAFAKSAPPEPVFKLPRKVVVQKCDNQEGSTLETKGITTVMMKGEKMETSSKIRRKEDFGERCRNVVRGVDKLARLLT